MRLRRLFGPPTPERQGTDEEQRKEAVRKLDEVERRLRLIESEARNARIQMRE